MRYQDLTNKHIDLICKALQEDFLIIKTDNKKMHFAFGIHREYGIGGGISFVNIFITDVDEEHIKKYMYELLHEGWCDHGICMIGIPFEEDEFTDSRICCMPYTDFRMVVKASKKTIVVADNKGFYGFD